MSPAASSCFGDTHGGNLGNQTMWAQAHSNCSAGTTQQQMEINLYRCTSTIGGICWSPQKVAYVGSGACVGGGDCWAPSTGAFVTGVQPHGTYMFITNHAAWTPDGYLEGTSNGPLITI